MHLSEATLRQIRQHGEATYPEECCGFLLGTTDGGTIRVDAVRPVENRRAEQRERRYAITATDYREAERHAARLGLDVVGFYHSHPDHPARPSATDLAEATFPGYVYVIVAVEAGRAADATAWTLAPDRSRFDPHPLDLNLP